MTKRRLSKRAKAFAKRDSDWRPSPGDRVYMRYGLLVSTAIVRYFVPPVWVRLKIKYGGKSWERIFHLKDVRPC